MQPIGRYDRTPLIERLLTLMAREFKAD